MCIGSWMKYVEWTLKGLMADITECTIKELVTNKIKRAVWEMMLK